MAPEDGSHLSMRVSGDTVSPQHRYLLVAPGRLSCSGARPWADTPSSTMTHPPGPQGTREIRVNTPEPDRGVSRPQ